MFISLYTNDHKPITFYKGLPEDLSGHKIPGMSTWHSRVKDGYFILYHLTIKPFSGWIAQYHGKSNSRYIVSGKRSNLILYHSVQGNIRSYIPGLDNMVSQENQIDFFYFPPSPFEIVLIPDNHYTGLIIQLQESRIQKVIYDSEYLKDWLNKIKTEGLSKMPIMANDTIKSLIQDMLSPELQGYLQRMLISNNLCRITLEFLWLISNLEDSKNDVHMADASVKAQLIRETLLNNIYDQHQPSLREIAKVTGMNEKKSEMIFKKEYGTTIFEFFKTTQMNMIHYFVISSELPITEIAERFGYSNHSALSKAFKHWFGMSPNQLRKHPDKQKLKTIKD